MLRWGCIFFMLRRGPCGKPGGGLSITFVMHASGAVPARPSLRSCSSERRSSERYEVLTKDIFVRPLAATAYIYIYI